MCVSVHVRACVEGKSGEEGQDIILWLLSIHKVHICVALFYADL